MSESDHAFGPAEIADARPKANTARLADSIKLTYIDACRGIAILMVILVHHSESFTYNFFCKYIALYGQMGVQLFFIASAFTMCLSAEVRRAERFPVIGFYLRRFFRIAPLYYVGLILYAALAAAPFWTGFGVQWPLYTFGNVLANILLVHGFSPSAYNGIVPGGWSVGTEVAFYLLFPLLFAAYRRAYAAWGAKTLLIAPLIALLLNIAVQSLIEGHRALMTDGSFLYCCILNQLPVFLIGMSGFFAQRDGFLDAIAVRDKAITSAILTVVGGALLQIGSPATLVLLQPVAALSFLLLLDVLRDLRFRNRLIERIGQVSYSMYIFHFLFAWTATRMILPLFAHVPHGQILLYAPTLLASIAASYGVGIVSKAAIEDPFIRIGKRVVARCNGLGVREAKASS